MKYVLIVLALILAGCSKTSEVQAPTPTPVIQEEVKKPAPKVAKKAVKKPVKKAKKKVKDRAAAERDCTGDALRLCPLEVAGRDGKVIAACMVRQKEKISPACKAHF